MIEENPQSLDELRVPPALLEGKQLREAGGEYFDALLQKMICETPQLRRLWTWKDGEQTLQDNIKLGIVFDLIEHLHKHYLALIQPMIDKAKREERRMIRGVAYNYPTKTAIQIMVFKAIKDTLEGE